MSVVLITVINTELLQLSPGSENRVCVISGSQHALHLGNYLVCPIYERVIVSFCAMGV